MEAAHEKIAMYRLRVAGPCVRLKEEMTLDIVLWEPTHGRPSRGSNRAKNVPLDECFKNYLLPSKPLCFFLFNNLCQKMAIFGNFFRKNR